MELIDKKFSNNKMRYVSQSVMATMAILLVLVFLDISTNAATVAALGSSAFIVFTMPQTKSSRPRFLIGGYVVAILTGSVCNFVTTLKFVEDLFTAPELIYPLFAAISVGLAIFIMVVTNTEHPPAGGVALGLVISEYDIIAVVVVMVGVVSLSAVKTVLRPVLINLL